MVYILCGLFRLFNHNFSDFSDKDVYICLNQTKEGGRPIFAMQNVSFSVLTTYDLHCIVNTCLVNLFMVQQVLNDLVIDILNPHFYSQWFNQFPSL